MSQTIGYIALVVRDYDEAIAFYTEKLGFTLVEDKPIENKRWVLVAPRGQNSPCLLLARAVTQPDAVLAGEFRVRGRDGEWRDVECRVRNLLSEPSVFQWGIGTASCDNGKSVSGESLANCCAQVSHASSNKGDLLGHA